MFQSSSGSCKNAEPLNHLPCTSPAEIPFVKSSATLNKVGQWDQSSGAELDWISAALQETKGLKLRVSPLIQARATRLSDRQRTLLKLNLDSCKMDFPRRLPSTAACSSRRGIVNSLRGATLALAATNLVPKFPSTSFHLA